MSTVTVPTLGIKVLGLLPETSRLKAGAAVPIPTLPPSVVSIVRIGVIEVEVEIDHAFTRLLGMVVVAELVKLMSPELTVTLSPWAFPIAISPLKPTPFWKVEEAVTVRKS
ncbi:hypothetical protein HY624_03885, partial [Candidatus Uhrbacteria bacterium]|nr:hypothetical protein [Candidatus Uhrbacteria bacterium]